MALKTQKLYQGMKPTWDHLTFTKWCKICNKKFTANAPNDNFCREECKQINRWMWARDNRLKKAYGIDDEHYRVMLKKQDGKCFICQTSEPGGENLHFCVDHNHKTGEVRKLLCNSCNKKVGMWETIIDDPLLEKIKNYL